MEIYFSRGFRLKHGERTYGSEIGTQSLIQIGDAQTNDLYARLRDPQMRNMDYGYATAIISHASLTFGDLSEWFSDNLYNNPNIGGNRSGWLVDTMGFIMTGDRAFDNETWMNLILSEGRANASSAAKIDRVFSDAFFSKSSSELFQLWISHEGGVADMLTCMFIAFGNEVQLSMRGLLPT